MTPLPKRKLSKARQGKRRRDFKVELNGIAFCDKCHTPKQPFVVCGNCGFYNGQQILRSKSLPAGRQVKTKKHEEPAGSPA